MVLIRFKIVLTQIKNIYVSIIQKIMAAWGFKHAPLSFYHHDTEDDDCDGHKKGCAIQLFLHNIRPIGKGILHFVCTDLEKKFYIYFTKPCKNISYEEPTTLYSFHKHKYANTAKVIPLIVYNQTTNEISPDERDMTCLVSKFTESTV